MCVFFSFYSLGTGWLAGWPSWRAVASGEWRAASWLVFGNSKYNKKKRARSESNNKNHARSESKSELATRLPTNEHASVVLQEIMSVRGCSSSSPSPRNRKVGFFFVGGSTDQAHMLQQRLAGLLQAELKRR